MFTPVRWEQRFQNFERAFLSLKESKKAMKKDPKNLFIRDSFIQRYEYSIELAWKTMKDYLENEGFANLSSPRKVVRQAFQSEILKDGSVWLKALEDRNRTSHAYDEKMAMEITKDIGEKYFSLLEDLYVFFKNQLRENA